MSKAWLKPLPSGSGVFLERASAASGFALIFKMPRASQRAASGFGRLNVDLCQAAKPLGLLAIASLAYGPMAYNKPEALGRCSPTALRMRVTIARSTLFLGPPVRPTTTTSTEEEPAEVLQYVAAALPFLRLRPHLPAPQLELVA